MSFIECFSSFFVGTVVRVNSTHLSRVCCASAAGWNDATDPWWARSPTLLHRTRSFVTLVHVYLYDGQPRSSICSRRQCRFVWPRREGTLPPQTAACLQPNFTLSVQCHSSPPSSSIPSRSPPLLSLRVHPHCLQTLLLLLLLPALVLVILQRRAVPFVRRGVLAPLLLFCCLLSL